MLNKLEKIYLDLFNSVDEYKINKDNQLEKFEEGLTKNNLPRGRWRYLSELELNMLKMGSND